MATSAEQPEIPVYYKEYVNAFRRLTAKRQIGFASEQPLTLSDIASYLMLFPTHDAELFVDIITQIDLAYLGVRVDGRK